MRLLSPAEKARKELQKAHRTPREAQHLLDSGYPSGAISRAYYAVFHAARSLLFLAGESPKSHRGVITRFSELYIKKRLVREELGAILQHERRQREFTDYEALEDPTKTQAKRFVDSAHTFVSEIADFLDQQKRNGRQKLIR